MSKPTKTKFRPVSNPALAKGMRDLAFSGASGTHQDGRTKRARTRNASLRAALRDA